MDFVLNYGFIIVLLLICISALGIRLFYFAYLPSEEKIENLMNVLYWLVSEAEKDLGSGTGALKLRKVYAACVKELPWVAKLMSFNKFADYVDDALKWMRTEIEKNPKFKAYIEGSGSNEN